MTTIHAFHGELMQIYQTSLITSFAFGRLTIFIQENILQGTIKEENQWSFGKGDPNNPNATYQFKISIGNLMRRCEHDQGIDILNIRNALVANAYSLWEDKYRQNIAAECNLAAKNDVSSDIFQDLGRYRRAIIHNNTNILESEPKIIKIFRKGDEISFSKQNIDTLFEHLINELNNLGEKHYGVNPRFNLHKPMNPTP